MSRQILIMTLLIVTCDVALAVVEEGLIEADLSALVKPSTTVSLEGDWFFYERQLRLPASDESSSGMAGLPVKPVLQSLPSRWQQDTHFGTYQVTLPSLDPAQDYAVELRDVYSAFRLWANGHLIAEEGRVAAVPAEHEPHLGRFIAALPRSERISLVLQVSNYGLPQGGVLRPPVLGHLSTLTQRADTRYFVNQILLGALVLFGLYSLILFGVARAEVANLYFGLFNLAIALRILLLESSFAPVSSLAWTTRFSIEEVAYFLSVPLFVLFARSMYPGFIGKGAVMVAWLVAGLYVLLVVLTPLGFFLPLVTYFHVFTILVGGYLFFCLVRLLLNGDREAYFVLAAGGVLLGAIVNDVFVAHRFSANMNLVPYGVLCCVLTYASVLAIRTYRSRDEVTRISEVLDVTNRELMFYQNSLEDEVANRTSELRLERDRAQQADAAKSSFLALMSHEIRTPLNAILGVAQLLEVSRLDEQQTKNVQALKSSSTHLMTLINNVLTYSKLENSALRPDSGLVNLQGTIQQLRDMFDQEAKTSGIELKLRAEAGTPNDLETYPDVLLQSLVNVMGNAFKFTSRGQISVLLKIETGSGGPELICVVEDTGVGISADKQDAIFDEFVQVDDTRSRTHEGTGLGLAITHKMLDTVGGSIRLQSKLGIGSVFEISIPVIRVDISDATDERRDVDPDSVTSDTTVPRILVVEDNEVNQMVITQMFQVMGYNIELAVNGKQAVESYEKHPADIVFTDIHMPVMDGIEASKRIQNMSDKPVCIIAMTADALPGDREKYLSLGMSDYVEKPIQLEKLRQVMDTWIATWRSEQANR